jgi:hypothetical protein
MLIQAAERGDESTAAALFSALYAELHRMAKRELARQGFAVSLSATTLLHEAYLDMARTGCILSRPGAIHGLRCASDAWPYYRPCP